MPLTRINRTNRTNTAFFKPNTPENLVSAINNMQFGTRKTAENLIETLIDVLEWNFAELINSPLKTEDSFTLFLIEVVKNYPDEDLYMIKLLMKHGADPYALDSRGKSAITIAQEYGYEKMLFELLTPFTPSFTSEAPKDLIAVINDIKKGHYTSAEEKIETLIDVQEWHFAELINSPMKTKDGFTLFLIEVVKNHPNANLNIIKMLVDNGADPYALDARGKSAIKIAEEFGYEDMLDELQTSTSMVI